MKYLNQDPEDPLLYLLTASYLENINIRYCLQQIGIDKVVSLINVEHLVQELPEGPDLILINSELDHPILPDLIRGINAVNEKIHIVLLIEHEDHNKVIDLLRYGAFDFVAKDENFGKKIRRIINTVVQLK